MKLTLRLSTIMLAGVAVLLRGAPAGAQYHSSLYQPGTGTATSLVELLPGPQLFIDDYLIESTLGLSRRVNVPQRDPAIPNPIVTGIEDHCEAPYSTVLQDPDTGRYRIWYNTDTNGDVDVAMMESDDGIHWQRPYQTVTTPPSARWGAAVIDEGPDYADPSTRYKLGYWNGGLNIATSPDGVTWSPMGGTVVPHDHDINNIWYDPIRERYVGIVSTYTTGPTWSGLRRVTMETVSQDLVHWADPWYIVTPQDSVEPLETQFYAMQGHLARGDLWIGMVKVLHDNWTAEGVPSGAYGMGHTELAWSRDGVNWVRDPEPFFEPDPTVGAWDHAHAWIDYQTIVGDEVYLYYGGYKSGHKWNRDTERQLGLLRMNLDRYVSRDAGASGGLLRTAPVLMVGVDSMTVNAKVDGQLKARLLDLSGQPIPGFDFKDCTTVSGDSLAHTIQWTTPLASLGLTPVRIQFGLQNAQLYGFTLDGPGLPEPGPTESQSFDEEIPAFVAGWRGRNHTPADGLGADLAFRASNHAGGTPGEIGGTIPGRGEDFVTYADTTLGGDPTQADVLTASGRFRVDSLQPGFEGGFELGFFDGNTTVLDATGPSMGGVHDFVGVRFIDGAGDNGVLRWFARAGSLAGDMTTPLAVGETYLFDLAYNPNGAAPGQGQLSIDLRRASDGISLGPATLAFASTGAPLDLNAFGLVGLDFDVNAPGATVYLDDLQYGHEDAPILPPLPSTTERQNFDDAAAAAAAGWTGLRNTPGDGLGVNLGFRATNHAGGTPGEAGGVMPARTPGFAYFADTDLGGSLTESDRITASGRFTIDPLEPGFDGGFELGFFNADDLTRVAEGGGIGGVAEALAIRWIEQDAGSVRWMVRAGDLTGYSGTTLQAGVDYLFDLLYEPSGEVSGPGSLTVQFRNVDTGAVVASAFLGDLGLAGFDLNAFGLLSLDFGIITPAANVYLDDLVYSNPLIPGDANADGAVDDKDASILASHWQASVLGWTNGDFNNDGMVNDADAAILAAHWSQTAEGDTPTPEPSAVVLLLSALVMLAWRRLRRS